jgi:uncharacterized protein (TIRG00374 family)
MRSHLRTLLVTVLTVGLIAFFLRNAQIDRVWAAMRGARVDLLIASLIVAAVSYLIRVERWRRLLQPVGAPSFWNTNRATLIGFAANALLPGRIGEVLRPYVLAKREGFSGAAAFGTVVVERLLDLLVIVLSVAGFVLITESPTNNPQLLTTLRTAAVTGGTGAVVILVMMVWLARSPARSEQVIRWCVSVAPGRSTRFVAEIGQRFLQGLAVVGHPGPLIVAMSLSVVLLLSVAYGMWLTSLAFGIGVSFGGSVILMGMVAIGVAVPTPAGVGGYHAAYELGATSLYGAGVDQAVAAALVMHMLAFLPLMLPGLVLMAQEGLRLGSLSGLAANSESSDEVSGAETISCSSDRVPAIPLVRGEDGGSRS